MQTIPYLCFTINLTNKPMGKFTRVNINEELAKSFREVFTDRLETPKPKQIDDLKLVEPKEKLSLIEWKDYIRNELKKFV